MLIAIVLSPAFYKIHLNYISVYLFSFNLLSSDVGVEGGGVKKWRSSVRPCVRASVHPKGCVRKSSQTSHPTFLKLGRISCSGMKLCMWFWMFDSIIFDSVTALLDFEFPPYKTLVFATPSRCFIRFS